MASETIEHHILNLGAGVQSTALYLMFANGNIKPQIECAIFADTQDEPGAEQRRLGLPDPEGSVYSHLDWLKSLNGPPIWIRSIGQLSANLMTGQNSTGQNSTGQRFVSIPAYTLRPDNTEGQTRRQCSAEYKIDVIERAIRREICGALPGRRIPKGHIVIQYIGISLDEAARATRVMRNAVPAKDKKLAQRWNYGYLKEYFADKNWRFVFPLIDHGITRQMCQEYLAARVPHKTPRSACTFCPFRSDLEWERLRQEDPVGWQRAVAVDYALRVPGNIINRNMDQPMFLHRSCKPLDLVVLDTTPKQPDNQMLMFGPSAFARECLGVCGL